MLVRFKSFYCIHYSQIAIQIKKANLQNVFLNTLESSYPITYFTFQLKTVVIALGQIRLGYIGYCVAPQG